jgi:hypothetical protein
MTTSLWAWGLAVVLLVYLLLVALVGGSSGNVIGVATDRIVTVPLVAFVCAWSGVWAGGRMRRGTLGS